MSARSRHGRVDTVHIGGGDDGRLTLEPGWKWSTDLKPLAGTQWCEAPTSSTTPPARRTSRWPTATSLMRSRGTSPPSRPDTTHGWWATNRWWSSISTAPVTTPAFSDTHRGQRHDHWDTGPSSHTARGNGATATGARRAPRRGSTSPWTMTTRPAINGSPGCSAKPLPQTGIVPARSQNCTSTGRAGPLWSLPIARRWSTRRRRASRSRGRDVTALRSPAPYNWCRSPSEMSCSHCISSR